MRLKFYATEYVDIDTAQIWTKKELKQLIYKIVSRKSWIEDNRVYSQTYVKIIGKQLTLF